MRRLCSLYKVLSTKQPACIHDLIRPMRKFSYFKNSFFPSVVSNWNKLDQIFVILAIIEYFAYLIRAVEMKTYHNNNSVGIKLLTRLRLSFSLLHENRFRHNFKNTLNFLCSCITEPATTTHFFCAVTSTVKTKHSSQITWKILINLFLH